MISLWFDWYNDSRSSSLTFLFSPLMKNPTGLVERGSYVKLTTLMLSNAAKISRRISGNDVVIETERSKQRKGTLMLALWTRIASGHLEQRRNDEKNKRKNRRRNSREEW